MSSSLSVPKEIADEAATDVAIAMMNENLYREKLPFIHGPPGRPRTQRVVDAWFNVCVTNTEHKFRELILFPEFV
jgi:hypothetical protein